MRAMLIAAGLAALAASPALSAERAAAELLDTQGNNIGSALLRSTPGGVLVSASATGLPPGAHAFHIHETGACDPGTGFSSAGGHYAPRGNEHGFLVEGGPHAGDFPNAHVQDDGVLSIEYINDRISLDEGAEATLFDDDGSAIVIHAGEDDYESQPAGAAGDRLACGVIEPQ